MHAPESQPPALSPAPDHGPQARESRQLFWWVAIVAMVYLALAWGVRREVMLLRDPRPPAISTYKLDLWLRFIETRQWFRGRLVYDLTSTGVYPPATYSLLAPVMLTLRWRIIRALWTAGSLVALVWLLRNLVRHSLAEHPREKVFLGIMPFAFYPTGSAFGVGQLVPLVLPLLVSAIWLVSRRTMSSRQGWLAVVGMVLALIQPTLAAPFFWLFLWCGPRWKPAALVVILYLVLTAIACPFQAGLFDPAPGSPPALSADGALRTPDPMPREQALAIRREWDWPSWVTGSLKVCNRWMLRARQGTFFGATGGGASTIHDAFARVGLKRLNTMGSVTVLTLLGLWTWTYRRQDLWLLLGVTAIVARVWTYHRRYDDLLLLLPMITLFRITKLPCYSDIVRRCSAALFVGNWLLLLAPGLYAIYGSNGFFAWLQLLLWLATLGWLAWMTHLDWRHGRADTSRFPLPEPTAG